MTDNGTPASKNILINDNTLSNSRNSQRAVVDKTSELPLNVSTVYLFHKVKLLWIVAIRATCYPVLSIIYLSLCAGQFKSAQLFS